MIVTNDTLVLECENRSLDKWKATFTAKFVEEITHRTGNFKSFGVFVKMLSSAFDSDSLAVSLDLLTSEDLEALRQASGISGGGFGARPSSAAVRSKRYLILTYQGEFDKVHYPMALSYTDTDDVVELKRTIVQLRDELESIRSRPIPVDTAKENLSKDLHKSLLNSERLSKELNDCLIENSRLVGLVEALQRENHNNKHRYQSSPSRRLSQQSSPIRRPGYSQQSSPIRRPGYSQQSSPIRRPAPSIRTELSQLSPIRRRPPRSGYESPYAQSSLRSVTPTRAPSPKQMSRVMSPKQIPTVAQSVRSVPMSEVDARLEALQNFLRHQKQAVVN